VVPCPSKICQISSRPRRSPWLEARLSIVQAATMSRTGRARPFRVSDKLCGLAAPLPSEAKAVDANALRLDASILSERLLQLRDSADPRYGSNGWRRAGRVLQNSGLDQRQQP